MAYYLDGKFITGAGSASSDRQTIREVDENDVRNAVGTLLYLDMRCPSTCKRKHTWWVIDPDEVLHGDGSAPNYDAQVMKSARSSMTAASKANVDVSTLKHLVVVMHEPQTLSRVVARNNVQMRVKEHQREVREQQKIAKLEAERPAREEAQRQRNIERIGRPEPHWPVRAEVWRRVEDGTLVGVAWVERHGKKKWVGWENATHQGNVPLGDFIADYRWTGEENPAPTLADVFRRPTT